ncbi:hypothetical protein M422DRAFT_112455, partial [Sphaerobolus stellatus SS14]
PERLKMAILKLITACDLPISLVEHTEFRELFRLLKSDLRSDEIPGHKGMVELINREFDAEKGAMKIRLQKAPGKISLTIDCWSSKAMQSYIAITAHYIITQTKGDAWELEEELFGFNEIEGQHTGHNLSDYIMKQLQEFGIHHKLGWITTDNATNNDTMLSTLA